MRPPPAPVGIERRVVHAIDDADDRRVDRRAAPAEGVAGGLAFDHHQHALADAGADRVDRQQHRPARLTLGRLRLHEQQLRALELAVLLRGDDRADDRGRSASRRPRSDIHRVHDADNRGVGRDGRGMERERGFGAADEEHVLADAGARRVGRHQRAAERRAVLASGWITSSVTPDSASSLWVQTTVPTTRATCMALLASGGQPAMTPRRRCRR